MIQATFQKDLVRVECRVVSDNLKLCVLHIKVVSEYAEYYDVTNITLLRKYITSMTKIGTLNTAGFYSLLVRVNPVGMPFMLGDVFVQETAIGYNGG